MKRFLTLLCCVLIPLSLVAQQRTGNIYGTVLDAEGNPLPGVSVTLTGTTISPIAAQSNAEGKFRFLSLFPANDYVVKCELQGFKTRTETGIIVNMGKNAEITVRMEQGTLQEQVTVIATTPVVDTKRTQITHTVTLDMLQELPSARDPWAVLQLTPSVQMDRENIGGVESGQQAYFQSKGTTTQEWTLDGMQITDRSSNSSPIYWDFDMFEEMSISTGNLDVEHRDPGTIVSIVSRRGGNKLTLGGRFNYTNSYLQATRSAAFLAANNLHGYNHADDIKDFGFNAGGPLWKDKAWWYISYGIQQIQNINQLNVADKTYLSGYAAKINLQIIPSNRMELFATFNDKKKFGRDSSESYPPGTNQSSRFKWGIPTIKAQDEQTVSDNLFLSARVGKVWGGFGNTAATDMEINKLGLYDVKKQLWNNTTGYYYTDRPHAYYVVQAQYFNDNVMGTAHEIKLGFEINNSQSIYKGGWPGDVYVYENFYTPQMDWQNNGTTEIPPADMYRLYTYRSVNPSGYGVKRWAAYFNDVISVGRLNVNLGLRVDHSYDYYTDATARSVWLPSDPVPNSKLQNYAAVDGRLMTADTVAAIRELMPDQTQPFVRQPKAYPYFSPRIGLIYDIFGDGKTVVKLNYTLYPGNPNFAGFYTPYGLGGNMNFWWHDLNGDFQASKDELFWYDPTVASLPLLNVFDSGGNFALSQTQINNAYGYNWSGFTWGNLALSPSTVIFDITKWKNDITHELNLSVEKELMKNLGLALNFNYRRHGNYSWYLNEYPAGTLAPDGSTVPVTHIQNAGDYQVNGTIPSSLELPGGGTVSPGAAAGHQWWGIKPWADVDGNWNGNYTYNTPYYTYTNMPTNRYNTYWGLDFIVTKRLANKWMMNGSFTYQFMSQHAGDGWLEPTNNWAWNNQIYWFDQGAGSGKINEHLFPRWMFKITGMYQLPFDINISGTLSAHEGNLLYQYFSVANLDLLPTGGRSYDIPTLKWNDMPRLKSTWVINLKLEKMFRITEAGRMYFSVDCFNILNTNTITRRYDTSLGTFYFTGADSSGQDPASYSVPFANSGVNNEVLNPRLFRLGMRFQF